VCASSDLLRQQREYERAMLASINAHVGQKMKHYFDQLTDRLAEQGLTATVFSTKSNGGVMTGRNAGERPVETLLSGPAAGVVGATYMGRLADQPRLITLDIGGTSADVAIIDEEFGYTIETRIGDFPIMVPTVEISSIGAGGGSIAWLDEHGVLKVGPESAGSKPGPACYGQGGRRPTVTDAYLLNGWLDPEHFVGGSQRLFPELAERALASLGNGIGLTAVETARAIIAVATSNMYAQLVPLLARSGADPAEFALLAFGGAGPTHGFLLAREVGIATVIIPPAPGILCAFGCLVADLRADFVQTLLAPVAGLPKGTLEDWFCQMEVEARDWLAAQRASVDGSAVIRSADMRYVGQSFEITVPLSDVSLTEDGLTRLHRRYDEVYRQTYKTSDPDVPVEIVNLRVQIIGRTPKPQLKPLSRPNGSAGPRVNQQRKIHLDDDVIEATVYARDELYPGDRIAGPCIVEQYDTTSVIPPGFTVVVDGWGNLIASLDREGSNDNA
jgi:N-methylhydantoinase A